MAHRIENITVCDGIELTEIYVYNKGYLAGYINCILEDRRTPDGRDYETLYRIHDTDNGNDYTLVSVDYGWKLENDNIIKLVEVKLTEIAKELNINFSELEKAQKEYKDSRS